MVIFRCDPMARPYKRSSVKYIGGFALLEDFWLDGGMMMIYYIHIQHYRRKHLMISNKK